MIIEVSEYVEWKSKKAAKILISGRPGVGKTTLIKRLAEKLTSLSPTGFYTEELRTASGRVGFKMISFGGREGILAHVDFKGRDRVGRYGVDVPGFDRFLMACDFPNDTGRVLIIDEIGKMECLSAQFRRFVEQALDSPRPLIATIAAHGAGIIQRTKERNDIVFKEISPANRDSISEDILAVLFNDINRHD